MQGPNPNSRRLEFPVQLQQGLHARHNLMAPWFSPRAFTPIRMLEQCQCTELAERALLFCWRTSFSLAKWPDVAMENSLANRRKSYFPCKCDKWRAPLSAATASNPMELLRREPEWSQNAVRMETRYTLPFEVDLGN